MVRVVQPKHTVDRIKKEREQEERLKQIEKILAETNK